MNELSFDPNRKSLARLTPSQPVGVLQRQCACGRHTLTGEALPVVHEALASQGQLLDRHTCDIMETRFAHDFSQVQLSMDAQPYLGAQMFPTSPDDRSEREAERFSGAMSQTQSGPSSQSPMLRQSSGPRSRCDFGQVRVHTDTLAAQSAQALGAEAYTVGRHIVFGAERYAPTTETGKRLLAHELTHFIQQAQTRQPRLQLTRLRDWQANRAAAVSDADIRGTTEYQSYMNPALIWQTRHHMTDAEAIQACRYMLAALRNGVAVDWSRDAQTYMTRARDYLRRIGILVAEQRAWLAGEAGAAGRTTGGQIHHVAQIGGYGGGPTPWWTGLLPPERRAWLANAGTVISRVVASVRRTPLESMVAARGIVASPRECESNGAFAYYSSGDNRLHVGREWIAIAERNPRDVHDNIAHELGGHFEYAQYGTEMAHAIMQGVLASLSALERTRATAGPKSVFSAYAYPETEIFAELREHGLRTPQSGGDVPSSDVPRQLRAIRDRFAPRVARAIVTELRVRVQEASNISSAAKTLFDDSVRSIFPGLIRP